MKVKAYKNFKRDVRVLYGKDAKIYGPYTRKKDARRIVSIYKGKVRVTKLYAKVKLEIKLGRILGKNQCVDHIDENPKNDKFDNLQLLSRTANAQKSHKLGKSSSKHIIDYSRSKIGRKKSSLRSRGEKNVNAVLTDKQVILARKNPPQNTEDLKLMARILKCNRRTLINALVGKSFKHLKTLPLKKSLFLSDTIGRPKSKKWANLMPKIQKYYTKCKGNFSATARMIESKLGEKCCAKRVSTFLQQGLLIESE